MDLTPAKFCHFLQGQPIRHDYGNLYFRQPRGTSECLMIGPSRDQVDVMIDLATALRGNP